MHPSTILLPLPDRHLPPPSTGSRPQRPRPPQPDHILIILYGNLYHHPQGHGKSVTLITGLTFPSGERAVARPALVKKSNLVHRYPEPVLRLWTFFHVNRLNRFSHDQRRLRRCCGVYKKSEGMSVEQAARAVACQPSNTAGRHRTRVDAGLAQFPKAKVEPLLAMLKAAYLQAQCRRAGAAGVGCAAPAALCNCDKWPALRQSSRRSGLTPRNERGQRRRADPRRHRTTRRHVPLTSSSPSCMGRQTAHRSPLLTSQRMLEASNWGWATL
jgi:hypothetical protein